MKRQLLSLLLIPMALAWVLPLQAQQSPPINHYNQPEWLPQALALQWKVKKVIYSGLPIGDMPRAMLERVPKDSVVVEYNAEGQPLLVSRYQLVKGKAAQLISCSFYEHNSLGLPVKYTQFSMDEDTPTAEYGYIFHHDRAGRLASSARRRLSPAHLRGPVDSTTYHWTEDGQLALVEKYYNDKPGGWKITHSTSYYFDDSCHLFLSIDDDHSSMEDSTFFACDAQGRILQEWKSYHWAGWMEGRVETEEEMEEGHRAILHTSYEYDANCTRKVSRTLGMDPLALQAQFTTVEITYDDKGLARLWRQKKKSNPARVFTISYEFFP